MNQSNGWPIRSFVCYVVVVVASLFQILFSLIKIKSHWQTYFRRIHDKKKCERDQESNENIKKGMEKSSKRNKTNDTSHHLILNVFNWPKLSQANCFLFALKVATALSVHQTETANQSDKESVCVCVWAWNGVTSWNEAELKRQRGNRID